MNILCPEKSICPDDANALGNYSSEDPDIQLFRSIYFPNSIWGEDLDIWLACFGLCTSTTSQADADLCAHNNAMVCERGKQYGNIETNCSRLCHDGNTYTFSIPADTFFAESQAQANALATNWCNDYLEALCNSIPGPDNPFPGPVPFVDLPKPKSRACNDSQTTEVACIDGGKGAVIPDCVIWSANKESANRIARDELDRWVSGNTGCLTSLPRSFCKHEPGDPDYDQWVVPDTIAGMTAPFTWEVFGLVPGGINFAPSSSAMRVYGQWNETGNFSFRLTMTDKFGTYTYRNYSVSVMEITNGSSLPPAEQNESYSHTITSTGGWDPKSFSVVLGSSLPAGLTLDPVTGTISGIPTGSGDYSFRIAMTDFYGASCEKTFDIFIYPDIWDTLTWFTSTSGAGSATAGGRSGSCGAIISVGGAAPGGTGRIGFSEVYGGVRWSVNNPTSRTLTVVLTIIPTGSNWVPPAAGGVQLTLSGYALERTAPAFSTLASDGGVYVTSARTHTFTIPPGISEYRGVWEAGAAPAGPPYPGGDYGMNVSLEYNLV